MGAGVTRVLVGAGVVLVSAVIAGCGGSPPPGTSLPTFAPSAVTSDPLAKPIDVCAAMLSTTDVANVLGLDSAKVYVRVVLGMPSPTVGRTEKHDCVYTGERGKYLFTTRSSTYDSEEAARAQWERNLRLESGDRRDLAVGPHPAVLLSRGNELLLTMVTGTDTFAVQMPKSTAPEGRAPVNLIIDFAQRVLRVDPDAPTTPPTPSTAAPAATLQPVAGASG